MWSKVWSWLLDKSGGAVVGATVSAIGQWLYGAITGNPNVAAVLIGVAVALVAAAFMLVVAYFKFRDEPKVGPLVASVEPAFELTPQKPMTDSLDAISISEPSVEMQVFRGPQSSGGDVRQFTTTGKLGPAEIDLGIQPQRLHFDFVNIVLSKQDLPSDIEIKGQPIKIVWFTDNGLVVNDHGRKISIQVSVLEGSRIQRVQSDAPQLLVHYEKEDVKEKLTFTNECGMSVKNVEIGPLKCQQRRNLSLSRAVIGLRPGQQDTCQMYLEEHSGEGVSLLDFLRSNVPHDAVVSVPVHYDDQIGTRLSRDFTITTFEESVIWEPGVVKLREPEPSS